MTRYNHLGPRVDWTPLDGLEESPRKGKVVARFEAIPKASLFNGVTRKSRDELVVGKRGKL